MNNLFFDLLKVLSKDDKLVLAAQTAEGIKAVAQGVAALSKRGGKLEKGANLTAIVFGGAADTASGLDRADRCPRAGSGHEEAEHPRDLRR